MERLHRFLTEDRVRLYSRGMLIGLLIAFLGVLLTGSGPQTFTGRLGGDYPEYYGIGRLIVEGDWSRLYSEDQQREFQRDVLLTDEQVIFFHYPPHAAFVYAPLSQLPFRVSYALYVLILTAALAGACVLFARIFPDKFKDPFWLFFVAFTIHPILRSVMGAQNTVLSILLIVLCWYKVLHNKHYQAGIFLGLLFFKPQFALPLVGLFLLSGRWRVWVSASATGALLLAIGTVLVGPSWFADWRELTAPGFQWAMTGNVAFVVSWLGLTHALAGGLTAGASVAGWALTIATIAAISWAWYAGGRDGDFNAQMGLAAVAVVVIAPQTLYYDAGIAMLAVAVIVAYAQQSVAWLVFAIWATSYLQLLSPQVGVSLTFVPLGLTLIFAVKILGPRAVRSQEPL